MALKKCPECEHDISDKAITCPNCGHPMEERQAADGPKISVIDTAIPKKTSKIGNRIQLVIIAFGVLFAWLSVFNIYFGNKDSTGTETSITKKMEQKIAARQKLKLNEFRKKRASILKTVKDNFDKENYNKAISICKPYLAANDEELMSIYKNSRQAILLSKLEEISKIKPKDKLNIYTELSSLFPNSSNYQKEKEALEIEIEKNLEREKREKEKNLEREKKEKERMRFKEQFTKDEIRLKEIGERLISNKAKMKKYYASMEMIKNVSSDLETVKIMDVFYSHSKKKGVGKFNRRIDSLINKLSVQSRVMFSSNMASTMLKSGMNAKVKAIGPKKTTLWIKYTLMSDVVVYQFRNEYHFDDSAKKFGFKKMILTNGFNGTLGETWTLKLN